MSEDKNFQKVLDKAKELESFNFSKDSDFNVGDYYSVLEKIAKKNQNFKNEEAESIVEKQSNEMIVPEYTEELEKKRKTVENFIRKYNPNSDEVKNMEISEVDKVYAICNYLLNAYIQYVNDMEFFITFQKTEAKWLDKVLLREIDYNGDEVFNFVELFNNFWKKVSEKLEEDKASEVHTFSVKIKDVLILHHLIKNHTVRGRTHDFKHFQSVLYKIANINKLFNAYNIIIERIKADREIWGNSLDEVLKEKDPEYLKQVELMKQEQEKNSGVKGVEIHPVTDADLGKNS